MYSCWFARLSNRLQWLATSTTAWVGSSWAFLTALIITSIWLTTGPVFGFRDTWQLVMNTISSIVTFLMVFLLQRSQNKEFMALQLKLNELIAAKRGASNRLINVEDLSEEEVYRLHEQFRHLADALRAQRVRAEAVSIEHVAGSDNPCDDAPLNGR